MSRSRRRLRLLCFQVWVLIWRFRRWLIWVLMWKVWVFYWILWVLYWCWFEEWSWFLCRWVVFCDCWVMNLFSCTFCLRWWLLGLDGWLYAGFVADWFWVWYRKEGRCGSRIIGEGFWLFYVSGLGWLNLMILVLLEVWVEWQRIDDFGFIGLEVEGDSWGVCWNWCCSCLRVLKVETGEFGQGVIFWICCCWVWLLVLLVCLVNVEIGDWGIVLAKWSLQWRRVVC